MLEPLPEADAFKLRARVLKEVLSSPSEFDVGWLKKRGWCAVPLPDQITKAQAYKIASAARQLDYEWANAVTTELEIDLEGMRVPLTPDGLLAFDTNCQLRAFLLAPNNFGFALLEEGDYFYVVAGPPKFVRESVGGSIVRARQTFDAYIRDLPEKRSTREWLRRTSATYAALEQS